MYEQEPDFNECSSLQEAAKRAWDWAWNHPELNPSPPPALSASGQDQPKVYLAAARHLLHYVHGDIRKDTGFIDLKQIAYDIADAMEEGIDDWVRDQAYAMLEKLEERGQIRRINGEWIVDDPGTEQDNPDSQG